MSRNMHTTLCLGTLLLMLLYSCGKKKKPLPLKQHTSGIQLQYASGFTIEQAGGITTINVSSPWPGATSSFTYALVPRSKWATTTLPNDTYDAVVATPVQNMVVTSTTHIPSLEALGALHVVSGFPNTDLISSPAARKRIKEGHIKELGTNESINTEVVMALGPEVVMGFGINDTNKAYETIKRSGIPIVYNGDWAEPTPLGKAEWIKFFAPFLAKETEADSIFKTIETSYIEAKLLTQKVIHRPTVLTGGLYKDVWHVAGGNSWMAQFLKDANANYLWSDSSSKGSIGLSLEAVVQIGQQADYWFNPSLHSSYRELERANAHYEQFKAFTTKNVYSNAVKKGPTGGLLFYELAPQRPDLVLKDLISILHPGLLTDYQPHFFMPLH